MSDIILGIGFVLLVLIMGLPFICMLIGLYSGFLAHIFWSNAKRSYQWMDKNQPEEIDEKTRIRPGRVA